MSSAPVTVTDSVYHGIPIPSKSAGGDHGGCWTDLPPASGRSDVIRKGLGLTASDMGRGWFLPSCGCNGSGHYRPADGAGLVPNKTEFPRRPLVAWPWTRSCTRRTADLLLVLHGVPRQVTVLIDGEGDADVAGHRELPEERDVGPALHLRDLEALLLQHRDDGGLRQRAPQACGIQVWGWGCPLKGEGGMALATATAPLQRDNQPRTIRRSVMSAPVAPATR